MYGISNRYLKFFIIRINRTMLGIKIIIRLRTNGFNTILYSVIGKNNQCMIFNGTKEEKLLKVLDLNIIIGI